MLFQTLLACAATTAAFAASCAKPVIFPQPGVVSAATSLTLAGTTTWPCWEVQLYLFDYPNVIAYGQSGEFGDNVTWDYALDTWIPQGDLRWRVLASSPFFELELEPTWSDEVVITYGHSGCPEPDPDRISSRVAEDGSTEVVVFGYSIPYYQGGCGTVRAYVNGAEWNDIELDESANGTFNMVLKNAQTIGPGEHQLVVTKEENTGQFAPGNAIYFII